MASYPEEIHKQFCSILTAEAETLQSKHHQQSPCR